ncbi:peptide-methionine (S)-S-oxide reductase [Maribacter dokdonensis]|uniref:peptide-methionine (S)-S-oxide reductase n=1 Tax=Maribacter dokdonensis TaxID=320912 RepID=UPI001C08F980|nr:peptide-methionine (S)-S-oxide reductase [Maribacter dokdonensis]MBU2902260.1 peptide-methionine (S)-S-oxide reductase [Maribacter dokdonensis]
MQNLFKIGFGGGCHWCTEAVFMALKGVHKVEQGFIAPKEDPENFSEAVIVYYYPNLIALKDLVAIHLDTHRSTQNHSMRHKYRSGIYYFMNNEQAILKELLSALQLEFKEPIITGILPFGAFNVSEERFQNYYFKDTEKPFCKTHITPKIQLLKEKYAKHVSTDVL